MAEKGVLVRVEEDDPTRCQGDGPYGQCNFKAIENGQFCIQHGGFHQQKANKQEGLKNLRITFATTARRLNEMNNSSGLKTLQDEVSVLRFLLEATINRCESEGDLLLQSHTIADLVTKIEKVVTSCNKLDMSISNSLDKSAILRIVASILDAINQTLADSSLDKDEASYVTNAIANKIIPIVQETSNETDD